MSEHKQSPMFDSSISQKDIQTWKEYEEKVLHATNDAQRKKAANPGIWRYEPRPDYRLTQAESDSIRNNVAIELDKEDVAKLEAELARQLRAANVSENSFSKAIWLFRHDARVRSQVYQVAMLGLTIATIPLLSGCFQSVNNGLPPTDTGHVEPTFTAHPTLAPTHTMEAATVVPPTLTRTPAPTSTSDNRISTLIAQATQSGLATHAAYATVIAQNTQTHLNARQNLVNAAQATDSTPTLESVATSTPTPESIRPETVSHPREAVVEGNTAWEGVNLETANHSAEIAPEVVRFIQDEFQNPTAEQDNTFITNLTNPHDEDLTRGNDQVTPDNEDEPGLGFTDAAIDQLSSVTGEARLQMPIEDVLVSNGAGTGEVTTFSIGAAHDHQFSSLITAAGMVFELHKEAILTSIAGVPEFQDGLTVEEFLTDPRFQSFRPEINGTRAELEAEYICEVLPLSEGEQFRRETTDTDIAFDGSNWMIENGYSPSSDQWNATIVSNEPVGVDVSRQNQVQTLQGVVFRDQNDDPESTTYFPAQNLGDQSTFTPIAWGATLDIDGPDKGEWDFDAFSAGILVSPDGTTSIAGENFAAMLNEIQRCGRRGEVAPTVTPTETVIAPTGERSTDVAPSDTPVFTSTVVASTETPTPTRTLVPNTITPASTNTHEFTRVPSQTATRGVTPTDVHVEPSETPVPTSTSTTRPTNTQTPRPTATETPQPSATPTERPTNTATRVPPTETARPTATRTAVPTATETRVPTSTPTETLVPTSTPTRVPPTETLRPTNTATAVPPTETPWPTATATTVPTEVQPTPTFAPTNTDVFPTLPPVEPTQGVTPTHIPIDG